MPLHQHKNIREQTVEELHSKIQLRQTQRLLVAIEAKALRGAKLTKLSIKEQIKYNKLADKLVTKLAKIDAQLTQCEIDIQTLSSISNALTQYDMELDT